MILVNTPGSWSYVYSPLKHADWHGCTLTDFVFPFFLFIVGTAMAYSFEKLRNQPVLKIAHKIIKRVMLIFLIGLMLNAFPFQDDFSQLRFLGVLQRIALAYGIAAPFCLLMNNKSLFIIFWIILTGYWMLMFTFGQGDVYSVEGNFARIVDLNLLGENHLWRGKGIPFDPEGLLSTIPAVGTIISGYLTGRFIRGSEYHGKTVSKLLITGVSAILIGKLWDTAFPINKYLWTSSYVVYTSGWAILLVAILLWLIDIKKIKKWNIPFDAFGMNPLFIYVLSILWIKTWMKVIKITEANGTVTNGYHWMFTQWFAPLAGNYNGSLLFAVIHVSLFCGISLILYRQKIFIKI